MSDDVNREVWDPDYWDFPRGGLTLPLCVYCKHDLPPIRREGRPVSVCAAFPNGIPDQILSSELDHIEPVAGDKGIQWELADNLDLDDLPDTVRERVT